MTIHHTYYTCSSVYRGWKHIFGKFFLLIERDDSETMHSGGFCNEYNEIKILVTGLWMNCQLMQTQHFERGKKTEWSLKCFFFLWEKKIIYDWS